MKISYWWGYLVNGVVTETQDIRNLYELCSNIKYALSSIFISLLSFIVGFASLNSLFCRLTVLELVINYELIKTNKIRYRLAAYLELVKQRSEFRVIFWTFNFTGHISYFQKLNCLNYTKEILFPFKNYQFLGRDPS